MTGRKGTVTPGRFYGITRTGELVPIPIEAMTGEAPGLWICRRLADFPEGKAPSGAAVSVCSRCGVALAFNPAPRAEVPADTPKVCMQCAAIEPLPIKDE